MLLILVVMGWFMVSPAVHYYFLRQHPLATFHWLAPVFRCWARDRGLMTILVASIVLHFIGTRTLGQVSYNTTGFDVLTHTLFGFLAREMLQRANTVHPFTDQIREWLPKPVGGMVTVTMLALAFCLAHEFQEVLQTIIPGLSEMVYIVGWQDQIKDIIMDTVGIGISIYKEEKRLVTGAVSIVFVVGLCSYFFSEV